MLLNEEKVTSHKLPSFLEYTAVSLLSFEQDFLR